MIPAACSNDFTAGLRSQASGKHSRPCHRMCEKSRLASALRIRLFSNSTFSWCVRWSRTLSQHKEYRASASRARVDPDIELVNDNTPQISRMQIDLLVNALANDMTRVASLQFMRSVGQARMRWLNVEEGHHSLSHEPDSNQDAQDKLLRINQWSRANWLLADQLGRSPNQVEQEVVCWITPRLSGSMNWVRGIRTPFPISHLSCLVAVAGSRTGVPSILEVPHNRLWLSGPCMGMIRNHLGTAKHCVDGPLSLG